MHAAVLVLDVGMRPLRVEPWQRAICDLFLGKVEVVEYSRDRTIQGVARAWPLPSVVRVVSHFRRERIRVRFSRLNIYARDGFTCQYCGGSSALRGPDLRPRDAPVARWPHHLGEHRHVLRPLQPPEVRPHPD